MREFFVKCSDGYPIGCTAFEPESPVGKLLIINGATGVPQRLYYGIAQYLAELGIAVITYDYRGVGKSAPANLRGFEASMRIWGDTDFAAITGYAEQHYASYRKFCLGHSIGALIVGMNEGSALFEKFIFMGTQNAYIGNLKGHVKASGFFVFGVAQPATTLLSGYFPARLFGLGKNLAKGVGADWRTLILNPQSTSKLLETGTDHRNVLHQETTVMYADDDAWMTEKGVKSLMEDTYPQLRPKYKIISAAESPEKKIGHINFFRNYNKPLWKYVADELK